MFDLDADMRAAHAVLRQDAWLRASIDLHPGLRIPGAWEGFEVAVAATLHLGAQADESPRLMQRLLDRCGAPILGAPQGLDRLFPTADLLAVTELESTIGASRSSAHAVRRLAVAVRDGQPLFGPGQRLDEFVDQLVAITAMPRSLAHHVAWRALGDPDAWPVDASQLGHRAGTELAMRSLAWRPWRGYAALHLGTAAWPRRCEQSTASGP